VRGYQASRRPLGTSRPDDSPTRQRFR
jgi:hypothetical protein